jgi:DNA-binding PadR family transcriptional regulator
MDKYVHLMALENLLVKMCRDGLLEVSFNDDGEPLYTSTELGREAFQQEEEGEEWKS